MRLAPFPTCKSRSRQLSVFQVGKPFLNLPTRAVEQRACFAYLQRQLLQAHPLLLKQTFIPITQLLRQFSQPRFQLNVFSLRNPRLRLIVGSLLLALVPLYSIFLLTPGSPAYFAMVLFAGALVNAGMPMLIVSAQDHSPNAAATAAGMLMGFSAGVAGLVYVVIGRLQESLGLAPAIMVGYLALIAGAILALVAIKPNKPNDEWPVDATSCLCSPCIDQNVAVYPKRIKEG